MHTSSEGNSLLHLPGPLAQAFTFRAFGAGAISICLLVLAVASVADAHRYFASASFEQTHRAQPRARKKPLRKPDVIYYPTPPETVAEMLRMAEVKKGDVLYDLGSGDGRIPIAAALEFGIRAVGIEIDAKLVKEAEENARQAGVTDLVRFRNEDMFHIDVHEATIVTLYLSEKLNVLLRPKLLSELRPGSRILSHDFLMGDWKPEKTVRVPWGKLYRLSIFGRSRKSPSAAHCGGKPAFGVR